MRTILSTLAVVSFLGLDLSGPSQIAAAMSGEELFVEVQTLVPDPPLGFGYFGHSMSMDGDRLIVGSRSIYGADGNTAFIFERRGGVDEWDVIATLGDGSQDFSSVVAISGSTAAVCGIPDVSDRPTVFVFDENAGGEGNWGRVATIGDPTDPEVAVCALALDGDRLAVGTSATSSDSVYVFERDAGGPGQWGHVATLQPSDGDGVRFGSAIAIDGDLIVVGDYWKPIGEADGAAYVFERDPAGGWYETAILSGSDADGNDDFGVALAAEEGTIVVGAKSHSHGFNVTGGVYIFERDPSGEWFEADHPEVSDLQLGDHLGISVAIDGDRVVAGADGWESEDDPVGTAWVFQRSPIGTWDEIAQLRPSVEGEHDDIGSAVGIAGPVIIVGAEGVRETNGAAYVFAEKLCTLEIALPQRMPVAPGSPLVVDLYLEHNRIDTVHVPFAFAIENAAGELVSSHVGPARTFGFGDEVRTQIEVPLPDDLPSGLYRVFAGISEMNPSERWTSETFRVGEQSVDTGS